MFEDIANEQEWRVFKILCPKQLMDIIKRASKTGENRRSIVAMFDCLGFMDLSFYFFTEFHFKFGMGECIKLVKGNTKSEKRKYTENELIQMFIDNIESDGIKDLFVKKADYMCTARGIG